MDRMLRRVGLALALFVVAVGGLHAEIHIDHIQAAMGPYWPTKKDLVYYPGDVILFRYLVSGMKVDSKMALDATVTWSLRDSEGKMVETKSQPWTSLPALGQGTAPQLTVLEVKESYTPGQYELTVEVKDNLSSQKASFQRQLTIKPVEWAIAAVAFFRDAECRHDACLDAHVGEQVFYQMKLIGYDKTRLDGEIHVEMLDKDGKAMVAKPYTHVFVNNKGKLIQSLPFLVTQGALPQFTRPGDFTLRITAIDHVKEQTTTYEAPVHVSFVP
jgi:hypothetical protein